MKNKFDQTYRFILKQINRPILKVSQFSFNDSIKSLILEDYHTFPVPKTLLDDIENFVSSGIENLDISGNNFIQKKYSFQQILNRYTKDWQYYEQFLQNVKAALKKNSKCTLVVCLFLNQLQAKNILKTYQKENLNEYDILNSKATIYSYDDEKDFNACLCIKATFPKNVIRKAVQHQLIHWMQISLNSHVEKTHGIFNDVKFNLDQNQLKILSFSTNKTQKQFIETYQYLLNGKQFEAWVANTCEQFNNFKLTIEKFKNVVQNDKLFQKYMLLSNSIQQKQMYLFGRICYATTKANSSDDRYWYLIEALKENIK